jgi:hypothetical protein
MTGVCHPQRDGGVERAEAGDIQTNKQINDCHEQSLSAAGYSAVRNKYMTRTIKGRGGASDGHGSVTPEESEDGLYNRNVTWN